MDFSLFILNSILFGVALAMDAFTVSLSNGLNEPGMKAGRMCAIAGTFGGFQILMPVIGWSLVSFVVSYVNAVSPFIPWIAFGLLLFLGIRMIVSGLHGADGKGVFLLSAAALLVQGVATSIDALSVGLTISDIDMGYAVLEAVIIGIVTFLICLAGLEIGKRIGTRISGKAELIGGLILIGIGVEILIKGII